MKKDGSIRIARRLLIMQVQGTKLFFTFPLELIIYEWYSLMAWWVYIYYLIKWFIFITLMSKKSYLFFDGLQLDLPVYLLLLFERISYYFLAPRLLDDILNAVFVATYRIQHFAWRRPWVLISHTIFFLGSATFLTLLLEV